MPDEAFTGVDAELEPGRVVGEYRIEGKLGKGGFGTVYRAVHPLIGKAAAVKVLARQYSASPQMVARFIAEARAVNQIRHRHIIDIFSFGSLEDGRQYFVMELLEGMTLDAYLKQRGQIPPDVAIPILRAVGRALDAAHARGIAHRDLKPENVFLAMQDGEIFPKLLDFGIAKLMGEAGSASGLKTNTGTPIGTPFYMSPEQTRGRDVDHRTDIYSFGIMAHEILTGKLPFSGGDVMEILLKQMSARPPAMSSVNSDLPPSLDAPVFAMLEKEPDKRPVSLSEAVEALARAAREAGYSIPTLPMPGESGPRIFPTDLGSARNFAEAETIGATPVSHQTLQGTASESTPPPGRPLTARYVALGGLALGALAVVAFVAMRGQPQAAVTVPTSPAPTTQPSTSAAGRPGPEPSTAPVASTVRIAIASNPPGAAVMRGAETLGRTPITVSLDKAREPTWLTLRLEGHETARVEVTLEADRNVDVPLVAVPAKAAPAARPPPKTRPNAAPNTNPNPNAAADLPANPFDHSSK